MVHLQKDYDKIKAQGAEVLVIFREDKKEVDGLKISAAKTGAKFNLLTDLGRKVTSAYQGYGKTFNTYVIGKDGKVHKILGGNKFVRPNAQIIIEALKSANKTP